jgi:hypothetical protein
VHYAILALAVLAVVWGWYEAGAVRRLLLSAVIFVGVILLDAGITSLVRLGQPWLSLAATAAACVGLAAWSWILRPHEVRERRREHGVCVGCGYDLTGNVSGVCPECGEERP